MAAERHRMRDIRDIFRLRYLEQKSNQQIASSLGLGKTTVQEYLARAKAAGITSYSEISLQTEAELFARLGFKVLGNASVPLRRPEYAMPDWGLVHTESTKPSVTMILLWTEYREQFGERSYSYTQFCEHYRRWSRKLSVTMRQSHKAGEKNFVDYCDGLWLVDPATGERTRTQLFVGCLGASSYTFAEATKTQRLVDWIGSHVRMWNYFEGVAEITVPDNLRSAVTKPDRYEALINDSYKDLACHYGTCVIPARVAKPRDKGKVEAAVLLAQRWILARLRNRIFTSLTDMNVAIDECLEYLNNRKMRALGKSRAELFEEIDKPVLKPLPKSDYVFAEWKLVRANIDYHVTFDWHHYSVPYQLTGQELQVRATSTTIEVFHRGTRVASHVRSYRRNGHTTNKDHMPASHRAHAEWTPSRVIDWSKSVGVKVGELVVKILENRPHPEQGFRSAMGLIRLEKTYGKERLNKACARALELQVFSYQFVSQMLKNKMDFPERSLDGGAIEGTEQLAFTNVGAENIRGSKYYH